jgi:hypothetical protein
MYPIMGGGNVDMWHDRMYVHLHYLHHNLTFKNFKRG